MGTRRPTDRGVVRALGHPLRIRIMELVVLTGEQSPSSITRLLDQPLATVSRHVRLLRDMGFLELERTEPRRGSLEHFYRARTLAFIDDEEWAEVPVTLRRSLVWHLFREIFHDASHSGARGGFDAPEMHIDRITLSLDGRGRRELSEILHRAMREAEDVQRRSDGRADDDRDEEPTTLALLHFRTHLAEGDLERADERPTFAARDEPPPTGSGGADPPDGSHERPPDARSGHDARPPR